MAIKITGHFSELRGYSQCRQRGSYLTPIDELSTSGVISTSSPTAFVMLKTANVIALSSHTDASARCKPDIQSGIQTSIMDQDAPTWTDTEQE